MSGAMPAQQGQTPPYKILGRIASGGMGAVYLGTRTGATDPAHLVAIKVIHQHLAENHVFVNMLIDEAQVASKIHHRNVVGIIDVGAFGNRHFVVMPYIEGGTLSELVRRETRHLPMALVAHVLGETLDGLHAAHTLVDAQGQPLGLVHRDVSPGNILLGTDGITRVIDFGVAKAATRITHTAPGTVKGKFSYMAPEQAMGEQVDCRADVFAVGVVLWTVLTGKRLFTGKNSAHTIRNLMSADIVPPSQVRPKIPRAFDEVCLRALHRSPYKRYQSAAEMAAALRQAALSSGRQIGPDMIGKLVSEAFADRIEKRRKIIEEARRTSRSFAVQQPGFDLQVADLDDRQPVDSLTPPTPSARVPSSTGSVLEQRRIDTGSISSASISSASISDASVRHSDTFSNTPELNASLRYSRTGLTPAEGRPITGSLSGSLVPLSREEVVARTPRPRGHGKYVILALLLTIAGAGFAMRDQLRGFLAGTPLAPASDAPEAADPAEPAAPALIEPVHIPVGTQPVAQGAQGAQEPARTATPDAVAAVAPDVDAATAPADQPDTAAAPGATPDQASPPGTAPVGAADPVRTSGKPEPRKKPGRREPKRAPRKPALDIEKNPYLD